MWECVLKMFCLPAFQFHTWRSTFIHQSGLTSGPPAGGPRSLNRLGYKRKQPTFCPQKRNNGPSVTTGVSQSICIAGPRTITSSFTSHGRQSLTWGDTPGWEQAKSGDMCDAWVPSFNSYHQTASEFPRNDIP